MVSLSNSAARTSRRLPLIAAAILLAVELGAIGVIFKHVIDFRCLDNWPVQACMGASFTMVSLYCVGAALVLMAMLAPAPFRKLTAEAGDRAWPLAVNAAGVALALLPVLFMRQGAGTSVLLPAYACWGAGMLMLLGGLAAWVAPLPRWVNFARENPGTLLPVLAAGLAAPWLAAEIRPIWKLETIADLTFDAVTWVIGVMGYDVQSYPADKIIGAGDFHISVAPQCSGVEGFALVTLFVTLYLWLFRADLRFPLALLLYPVGLAASALFNVVRIAALLAIGLEGNADLAVGGFHSHAGWLMFTLVALGIVGIAQNVPLLQKRRASTGTAAPAPRAAPLPLREDPVAARILPFAIFMLSALLANAFSQSPGVIYPARVVLMIGVLALFWPIYARLPWRLDPVAALVGAGIGLMWVLIPVPPSDIAPYGTLTGLALTGWFICRGIGTILLVPLIEELFFRDYLTKRLTRGPQLVWRIVAILGTAALFAALHDRWAEAFVAGLAFSWVALRRDNITDAVLSHAVANAIVFAVAVMSGNLSII